MFFCCIYFSDPIGAMFLSCGLLGETRKLTNWQIFETRVNKMVVCSRRLLLQLINMWDDSRFTILNPFFSLMERKIPAQKSAFFTFTCQLSKQNAHNLILNFLNHQIKANFNKFLYQCIANTNLQVKWVPAVVVSNCKLEKLPQAHKLLNRMRLNYPLGLVRRRKWVHTFYRGGQTVSKKSNQTRLAVFVHCKTPYLKNPLTSKVIRLRREISGLGPGKTRRFSQNSPTVPKLHPIFIPCSLFQNIS